MEPFRPIRRFLSRLAEAAKGFQRRKQHPAPPPPAMIGLPPSQRPLWHNPAAHAKDFAHRYAHDLDLAVTEQMRARHL
jgi:hypothetical protein